MADTHFVDRYWRNWMRRRSMIALNLWWDAAEQELAHVMSQQANVGPEIEIISRKVCEKHKYRFK